MKLRDLGAFNCVIKGLKSEELRYTIVKGEVMRSLVMKNEVCFVKVKIDGEYLNKLKFWKSRTGKDQQTFFCIRQERKF